MAENKKSGKPSAEEIAARKARAYLEELGLVS